MTKPTVAILGARANRAKFRNKLIRAHLIWGYDVYPVNLKGGSIEGASRLPNPGQYAGPKARSH
jgi:predicted CoA-binding protein